MKSQQRKSYPPWGTEGGLKSHRCKLRNEQFNRRMKGKLFSFPHLQQVKNSISATQKEQTVKGAERYIYPLLPVLFVKSSGKMYYKSKGKNRYGKTLKGT